MNSSKGQYGFTLIEIVMAMAILGLSLIVLIELLSGGLRLGNAAAEYTQASIYGRIKIEEISSASDLKEGLEEGEFSEKYRWRLEIKRTDILKEKFGEVSVPFELYQIKLTINWRSGFKEKVLKLETYKFWREKEGAEKI